LSGCPKGNESVGTEPAKITITRLGTLTAVLSGPKVSPLTWPLIDELPPCSPEAGDRVGDELSLQAASTSDASSSPRIGWFCIKSSQAQDVVVFRPACPSND
jgi:hypothetical protein